MLISRANLRQITSMLKPQKGAIALLLVLNALQAVMFTALDPLALKYLIDAITNADLQLFLWLGLGVTLIATLGRVLMYKVTLLRKKIRNKLQLQLTAELSVLYYRHRYQEISQLGRGYYIGRLHDEPKQLSSVIDCVDAAVTGLLICLVGITVAAWLSWQITLALMIIVPVLILLSERYSGRIAQSTRRFQETEASFRSVLSTIIDSYKHVRQFGLQSQAATTVKQELQHPLEADFSHTRFAARYSAISSVFLSYAELAVLVIAGFQVIMGLITIGSMFALTRAFGLIVQAVQRLSALVPQLASLNAQLDRLAEFRAQAEQLLPLDAANDQHIVAEQLSFAYQQQPVLAQLSLHIHPGEKVLLSGGNGCGKSTLAHLLTGYLQPDTGSLLRPAVQDISALLYPFGLLPGTLRQNLAMLTDADRVTQLVQELGLEPCLDLPPQQLSEGQKKRCQIAICLLKPATLYLLDEPLANIDEPSKTGLMEVIRQWTTGATLIMIMHEGDRFISYFDRIVQLQPAQPTPPLLLQAS
jgi:ABC-type bacteriocin/lantibiotic exporter with double-glycine peptidase domain